MASQTIVEDRRRSRPGEEEPLSIAGDDGSTRLCIESGHCVERGDRSGIAHLEGVVASEEHPVGADPIEEVADRRRVVQDRVIVETPQRLDRRHGEACGDEVRHLLPAALHPTDLIRQEAPAVGGAQGHGRVALEHTRQQDPGDGDRGLGRPSDHVVEEPVRQVDAGEGLDRVQEHEGAKTVGFGPELVEPCRHEVDVTDPGCDLDTDHAEVLDQVTQLGRGSGRLLEGNGADRQEAVRMGCRLTGERLVDEASPSRPGLDVEAVADQIDPRRQHLHVDTRPVHGSEPGGPIHQIVAERDRYRSTGHGDAPVGVEGDAQGVTLLPDRVAKHGRNAVRVNVDGHDSVIAHGANRPLVSLRAMDPFERLITGEGRFVADLAPEGTLHCWFVRSPIAHGMLGSIDVEEATAAPGVVAVFTAADLDLPDIRWGVRTEITGMDRPVLARDRVRFTGEAVALVVATAAPLAEDAASLVRPDIDPLEAAASPEAALAGDALLFPERGSNIVAIHTLAEGPEPDGELVDVTVEVDHPRLAPSPLETLQFLAVPDGDRLLVWCGHQAPHLLRRDLAAALGLEETGIRVQVPDVGGAFGMKRTYPEYLAVARASLLLKRPALWSQTRSEIFLAGTHGRAQHHRVTLTADPGGRIQRARFDLVTDTGAYPHSGSLIADITRFVATGLYAIPRVEYQTTVVVTNTAPTAPYRGAGRPEAALAIERAVDALAAHLDLDPADVRRTNFVDHWPYVTPTGAHYDSGDYRAALDRALELIDYEDVRAEQARRRDAGDDPIGIGIGAFIERTGGAPDSGEYGAVAVDGDGNVVVRTGSTAAGQGHAVVWQHLVASVLTVDPDAVIVIAGDTDAIPRSVGSFASRSAQIGASAVWRVAMEARDRAAELAAELLEVAPDDLLLAGGVFSVVGVPGAGIALGDVAAQAEARGSPIAFEEFYVPGAQTFPYGVHVAVVDVERATGVVNLRRLVTVDDIGTALDVDMVEGQLHGSVMQGIGAALLEDMRYDEDGQPVTASFSTYMVPGAATPLHLESARTEHPAPSTPLGAKGAGEGGCIGTPPAILNATIDALGGVALQLPLLSHRVWAALQG
jgi:aerobic carbon-monoxide dehydrogenase large subunit